MSAPNGAAIGIAGSPRVRSVGIRIAVLIRVRHGPAHEDGP